MKEEILAKIRKEYQCKIKKFKEENSYDSRLFELQESSIVLEYLRLRGIDLIEHKDENKESDKILNEVLAKYLPLVTDMDTNNIYLFIGACVYDMDDRSYVYWNLEQQSCIDILQENVEDFEKKHNIIYSDKDERGILYMCEDVFPKIRTEFVKKALDTNQEQAKQYILSKYK